MASHSRTRRDFLMPPSDSSAGEPAAVPTAGSTIRTATRAMACEFSVIMNPDAHEQVVAVGDVLEMIHDTESWLSVYRSGSEISYVNRTASDEPVTVRRALFDLISTAKDLAEQTDGAFDIAAGAQIQLWRDCRAQKRIPTDEETAAVLERSGSRHLVLDDETTSVCFAVDGLLLDPGAIGKGFALDQAADWLKQAGQQNDGGSMTVPESFLLHGGHSSLTAVGEHNGHAGWPVGIGNPLLTKKRLGTVLLQDQAMSTSGSNIQFFRHDGRRYGHILDPRTAMPVDGMLSVTVFAESAAVADALSTAFFVLGVEKAVKCCDNLDNVGVILIPFPERGKLVTPTVIGVPADRIFWDEQQVAL